MSFTRTVLLSTLLLLAPPLWAEDWTQLSEGIRASDTVLVGGQPTQAVLQQAADAGIKVVVNFRGEDEDPGYDEAAAAAELGLTYLRVPVAGEKGLTQENVLLFDAVLQQVGDKPTLMHCSTGNRVGAIHALHAASLRGLDPDAAIDYGKQYGLTHFEDEVREVLEE
jgi:uncharacterized protein (TIGR01244 family)